MSRSVAIAYRSAASSIVVRLVSTWKPAKPKISNRASTRSASAAGAVAAPVATRSVATIAGSRVDRAKIIIAIIHLKPTFPGCPG